MNPSIKIAVLLSKRLPPKENLAAWFRKGIGITSASGAVSAWADQSGAGRNYVQATGTAQPALQADGTILFDGGTDGLKTAAFTLAQPYTRYLLVKQVTWTLNDVFADGNLNDTGDIFQGAGVSPSIGLYAGAEACANSDLALGSWGAVCAVFNGASSSLSVGYGAASTGNPGAAAAGGLALGAGANLGGPANIVVAEELVYSVAHDAATRARVIAYLEQIAV